MFIAINNTYNEQRLDVEIQRLTVTCFHELINVTLIHFERS